MNKSDTSFASGVFLVFFLAVIGFGVLGSFFGKPYKTDTAIATAALLGIVALMILVAGSGIAFI